MIAAGKPRQLMLIPAWWWVISARTYLDRLTNAPDLVENAKRIKCPVLFIRGDQEPKENYPAERFKENCAGPARSRSFPTATTSTSARKIKVSEIVTDWLKRNTKLDDERRSKEQILRLRLRMTFALRARNDLNDLNL